MSFCRLIFVAGLISALSAPHAASVKADDAPPLFWPSWLVHHGDGRQPQPAARKAYGETYLESRYRTSATMAELHQFYKGLVQANGYRIVTARLTTSQSVRGNIAFPAPYGSIEACRHEDGSTTGSRTCVKAHYSGNPPDSPVTVTLQVRVKGSFRAAR